MNHKPMPLASEVTTSQEAAGTPSPNGAPAVRFRSRVRTNVSETRLKRRLEHLGLLERAETIEHYTTNWHWTGTGQGFEILWRDGTTFEDLRPLARL
jgi:hypothetical protein